MTPLHALAILAAGVGAGTVNTIVGSGTLITFPTLLAFGYQPVIANVSNTIGLVPGGVSGAIGYRPELEGQRSRAFTLGLASLLGGSLGAVLLLILPAAAFKAIVPVFIGVALVLLIAQKQINAVLGHRRRGHSDGVGPVGFAGTFASGVYGGYFGAAQGILLLSIFSITIDDSLQRLNAVKVVAAGLVNLVAGLVFVFAAHVAWDAAGLIAAGSLVGGMLGARFGRLLPPSALKLVIVAVGITAIVRLA